ncbi:Asp-tRNA(Asn)/Glu-tRNA(Gln) amidotransferase subunit GatC [Pendulispora rubella]|uniref:Aspartyl/glutamyl-tRNA(Asn/Gln) amidotransferase subunit C n=1 Tax=Pendulispora rubella TaxID=2741070 RepID=A0ABZ2LEG0_9BACT
MTTRIDRAQVEHIAQLASLILADDETERLTRELADMVRYVEELNELDTANVEPTAYVQLERSELRTDEVEPCLDPQETLAQAPRSAHGGFAVPTFVES